MSSSFKMMLAFLLLSVALIQCVQVVARYVFAYPMPGLEEVLVYFTLWLYMLGSANASKTDTQISANVLDIFLKTDTGKLRLKCISLACSLGIALWLTYWGIDLERYLRKTWKTTPTLYLPLYFAEVAMLVGLVLMSGYTLYNLLLNLRKLRAQTTA